MALQERRFLCFGGIGRLSQNSDGMALLGALAGNGASTVEMQNAPGGRVLNRSLAVEVSALSFCASTRMLLSGTERYFSRVGESVNCGCDCTGRSINH